MPPTTEPTTAPPSATPNVLGFNFIAQYDPTTQVLTIFGTTPGATIVYAGTPLLPPPTATVTDTPAPTDTPTPTNTLPPPPPAAPRPTRTPAQTVTEAGLNGKIIFKTDRDGGFYPNSFAYYVMNPDGSNQQRLDFTAANALVTSLQANEGYSPDGSRVVLPERRCYGAFQTCALYILDTQLDAALINSNDDISHGLWFVNNGFQATYPVWSPAGNYIAFVSNHEAPSGQGCIRSPNIFKGTPGQKPVIRRLTTFCSGANVGHPSFNPGGSSLVFWSDNTGLKQIYVLDVGPDDTFDFRFSNPHIIGDQHSNDWDPLWVK